jgi:hypothetical protein
VPNFDVEEVVDESVPVVLELSHERSNLQGFFFEREGGGGGGG